MLYSNSSSPLRLVWEDRFMEPGNPASGFPASWTGAGQLGGGASETERLYV